MTTLVCIFYQLQRRVELMIADKYYSIRNRRLSDRQVRRSASLGHLGVFLQRRDHFTSRNGHGKHK